MGKAADDARTRGAKLLQSGETAAAATSFAESARFALDDPDASVVMQVSCLLSESLCHLHLRDWKATAALCSRVLELMPEPTDDETTTRLLVKAHHRMQLQQRADALDDLKAAASLAPNDRRIAQALLAAHAISGGAAGMQDDLLRSTVKWRRKTLRRQHHTHLMGIVAGKNEAQRDKQLCEDYGIAALLLSLFEAEEGRAATRFVEIGCGNGILTHLLNCEGNVHGVGLDRETRDSWRALDAERREAEACRCPEVDSELGAESRERADGSRQVDSAQPKLQPVEQETYPRLASPPEPSPTIYTWDLPLLELGPEIEAERAQRALEASCATGAAAMQRADWLIANHPDELTPYVARLASLCGIEHVFVLPCCTWSFGLQRYARERQDMTAWRCYLSHIEGLLVAAHFRCWRFTLPIPSPKNVAIIAHRVQQCGETSPAAC